MAAYASLISLMHIIDQIQLHPRPPISFEKTQVESLVEIVTILQEFLQSYSSCVGGYINEAADLESRAADAANAAEDIIESHIVDQILVGSTSHGKKRLNSIEFYQSLQKVIEDMLLIKEEVMKIKDKLLKFSSTSAVSSPSSASTGLNSPVVGFDAISYRLKDMVVVKYGGDVARQVIPVVGMPGIGKTTLARNIYQDQSVVNHFDPYLAWSTVSQQYTIRKILLELLQEPEGALTYMEETDLKEKLHKRLKGRRYLIILDDVWDIEVWYKLHKYLPNDDNGSRVILTTRLSKLASEITNVVGINMSFLDEENSWKLFSKTVFREEPCPLELKDIGEVIVKNCKGLPLSIVVVGGHLAKSTPTVEYWEYIANNLNSVVNLEDDERCFKILHMSYNHLPVYLKPCFLYMGVFLEDSELRFTVLIKLWVAEGFLKPIRGKSAEEVAEEFLKDLIDRNLILIHELSSTRNIKYCKIHDLLRDLSLRESENERFYIVLRHSNLNPPEVILDNAQRRVVLPQSLTNEVHTLQSRPLVRSVICDINGNLEPRNFRLLRIFEAFAKYSGSRLYSLEELFQLVNTRYLAVRLRDSIFPSSVYLLWNLQTLIIYNDGGEVECDISAPIEIWIMPQLRHVDVGALYLPDPPSHNVDDRDYTILMNLHTLKRVMNFKSSDEVVQKIPNIKKLSIEYRELEGDQTLKNLDQLQKLECFSCYIDLDIEPRRADHLLQSLTFPKSIKKLKIGGVDVHWDDILGKIGLLPLQVLKLMHGSFKDEEGKWETVAGQFKNLRFLIIEDCQNLKTWQSESTHFPCLERLVLRLLKELEEIPLSMAEIRTLESMELAHCSDSVINSAKKILEEQENLSGYEEIEVQVFLTRKNQEIESLATPKFQVRYLSLP